MILRRFLRRAAPALLAALAAMAAAADKRIAVTIDDLPIASTTPHELADVQRINGALLAALTRHKVEAVGFVNEDRLYRRGEVDARIAALDGWLAAGMELGNHGFGHPSMWTLSLPDYERALLQGEVVTRWLSEARGRPLRWWRHPYTQTGRNEDDKLRFEAFLSARGYRVAPITIEHDDYLFACVFERGTDADRARLVPAYLAHLEVALDSYESMSAQLFGRQIAQVFLVHANRLNAATLAQTLAAIEKRGYRFITLEEALEDPAYRSRDLASGRHGPSWLTRWAHERKAKLSLDGHPDPGGWVEQRHQELCAD